MHVMSGEPGAAGADAWACRHNCAHLMLGSGGLGPRKDLDSSLNVPMTPPVSKNVLPLRSTRSRSCTQRHTMAATPC